MHFLLLLVFCQVVFGVVASNGRGTGEVREGSRADGGLQGAGAARAQMTHMRIRILYDFLKRSGVPKLTDKNAETTRFFEESPAQRSQK